MKFFIMIISFGAICYTLITAVFYLFQDKMLFFPDQTLFGKCPQMERFNAVPETFGDIRYYLQAKPDPDSWIVIFHGNAGNACNRVYFLNLLKDVNANLVIFEYPGYGNDSNKPGETIFLDQALELVRHLKKTDPSDVPVYLMGESLGTGVATFVATRTSVRGLILISAYTSLAEVAGYHYSWLPVKYLMRHKFKAYVWAQNTAVPVLLFHGTDDDIIPLRFARQQVQHFKGKKELVEIPDCGHNDITDVGEKLLQKKIRSFLSRN